METASRVSNTSGENNNENKKSSDALKMIRAWSAYNLQSILKEIIAKSIKPQYQKAPD
jgi:hypothetical protein